MRIVPVFVMVGVASAFTVRNPLHGHHHQSRSFITRVPASGGGGGGGGEDNRDGSSEVTLKDLMKQIEKNPGLYIQNQSDKSKKNKRTRKRVDAPKQTYMYASQRRRLEQEGKLKPSAGDETEKRANKVDEHSPLHQAREMGLVNIASQHCDPAVAAVEPQILGRVRVGEAEMAGSYAYLIDKPAGWSVVGTKKKTPKAMPPTPAKTAKKKDKNKRIVKDEEGDFVEYDEFDLLSAMTPEEIAQYQAEVGELPKSTRRVRVKVRDDVQAQDDMFDFNAEELKAVLTPEEYAELQGDTGAWNEDRRSDGEAPTSTGGEQTSTSHNPSATFEQFSRTSVVGWLKTLKEEEGTPIRGATYWRAIAGATEVDDTGIVLLCPKDLTKNIFVDYAKYIAVTGNGKFMAAKPKNFNEIKDKGLVEMEVISKIRKGRGDDIVVTVGVGIEEEFSTCTHVVQACQEQLKEGVRGDPMANPLDRRAPRRLVHCDAMEVSSLLHDEEAEVETEFCPDDISVFADRRNNHEFIEGSFLGRADLIENPYTNAYREINGAGDGFEGWTVDRYDQWLWVQHDDRFPKGPLPSIHDGNTAGVYYLPANPNRGGMGRDDIRPQLIEGQPAPEQLAIQENGVTYLVNLGTDLSTGVFLDQRPQRAWLTRNCNQDTRVLNCFAHCGAFSVAAATAGASTVSLDLNKKWLERVRPQMELNGVDDFEERHDCIYGDCFDWLVRLAKRGEKFDIVIVDPPSSSVGKKKKRWSIKNDMDELVELAAPLVKRGGLLWTTTNNASIHPVRFARMCKKGLDAAGLSGAKLERVVPMPADFPSIGPSNVKNLVWRIPE